MPFGVDKKIGGDNKTNDTFMEKCVAGITGTNKRTGKPFEKGEKIAICKAQLDKKKEKQASQGIEIEFDLEELMAAINGGEMDNTMNNHSKFMSQCMQKMMDTGQAQTTEDAKMLCERALEINDNEVDSAIVYINRPKYNF